MDGLFDRSVVPTRARVRTAFTRARGTALMRTLSSIHRSIWDELVEPTPLVVAALLASHAGVGSVLVKDESKRALGNFKSLGGLRAGLNALRRAAGVADIATLLGRARPSLPPLICASAGNHGLAVAAAARCAGSRAYIYLHDQVPPGPAKRIRDLGAEIIRVTGTYDDAVREAAEAAERGEGLLIPDTSAKANDPVVNDVIDGYRTIGEEIMKQVEEMEVQRPSHIFVQAGVGGLAAGLASSLRDFFASEKWLVVVEPAAAASVAAGLRAGRPVRIAGTLETAAGMLACGEASASALEVLASCRASTIAVDEGELLEATKVMSRLGGIRSTPSGAAGLAGLLAAAPRSALANELGIESNSNVLVVATEGGEDVDD